VAEVATLLRVLSKPELADAVKHVSVYTLIDAGGFLATYARMPEYFEAQANIAPILIVNKADLATPAELRTIEQTLHALNPNARIVQARYGVVAGEALERTLIDRDLLGAEEEDQHVHDHEQALGLQSWSDRLLGTYDEQALRDVLHAAAGGAFGDLVRIKGIAQVRRGWVNFDLAGGQTSITAFAARADEQPRVVAIGGVVDVPRLAAALQACQIAASEGAAVFAPAV
jgi:G3E family GTPase